MKHAAPLFLLLTIASGHSPEPAIPYFSNVREIHISQMDRQNYFVVDEELWQHSRADLGDLRIYDRETPVQYALYEQRAGVSSEAVEARILNLGSMSGHTEFDVDAGGLGEYDRIHLRIEARDFVATASISGGSAPGQAANVELAPATLYDFSKEQLGSSSVLKLRPVSFAYLHIRLSPGIRPEQVKGATIANLREQQAMWSKAGTCGEPQIGHGKTEIRCAIPAKVPVSRIEFQIAPAQINFRREVTVEDGKGTPLGGGEISRVRLNRESTLVTNEELAVSIGRNGSDNGGQLKVSIDNGENPPLTVIAAEPVSLERRVYFDPQGKAALRLYYGDERLSAPAYDYARFFHQESSLGQAALGPGDHNPQYAGRPDDRPWSERHMEVLWGAMILAVLTLAALAFRGLRSETPQT